MKGKAKGFLSFERILKVCKDNNIVEEVREAKTHQKAWEIIGEYIADEEKISVKMVGEVRKKLKEENNTPRAEQLGIKFNEKQTKSDLEESKQEENKREENEQEETKFDGDENKQEEAKPNEEKIKDTEPQIQVSNNKQLGEDTSNNREIQSANEIISSTTVVQKDAVFIDSKKSKAVEESSEKINNLENSVESLRKRILELEAEKVKEEEKKILTKKEPILY